MTVEAISPALGPLLEWADADPEARMQASSIEAFRAGFEAAGRSAEPVPVVPSIALLAPSTRRAFAATFRAAAACFEEARCPDRVKECEDQAEALERSHSGEALDDRPRTDR